MAHRSERTTRTAFRLHSVLIPTCCSCSHSRQTTWIRSRKYAAPNLQTLHDSILTAYPSPSKISNIRKNHLRLPLNPGSRRSLGQQPLAPRRRLRPDPRPLSLRSPTRPARRHRLLRLQRRNLRHLRLPPAALPQARAHVPVHAQSRHGIQFYG